MMNKKITLAAELADFYNNTELVPMPWELEGYELYKRFGIVTDEPWEEPWEEKLRQELKWEQETLEWLHNHSGNPADPDYSEIYSDVYKDLYGVRPRW